MKKITILLIFLILVISIAACTSKNNVQTSSSDDIINQPVTGELNTYDELSKELDTGAFDNLDQDLDFSEI